MLGSKMRSLPGIIFVPGTKIYLLPGTKIIPGSKRIYCMDSLQIQDAGSISILRNFHPDQEGIKEPLTGKKIAAWIHRIDTTCTFFSEHVETTRGNCLSK